MFGELKFVRLPKKLGGTGSHRGFGFVDFLTRQDAKVCTVFLFHAFNGVFHREWVWICGLLEQTRSLSHSIVRGLSTTVLIHKKNRLGMNHQKV